MRRLLLLSAIVFAAGCSKTAPPAPKVETEEQKALYSLGYIVADSLKTFELTEAEMAQVKTGFAEGLQKKKIDFDPQTLRGKIQELQNTRMAAAAVAAAKPNKDAGQAYLDKAQSEAGAEKLESGGLIIPVKEGKGRSPAATDTVKVHYHGTLIDGKVFDSSVQRGEPIEFPLNQVIKCWTEGVQKIKVGGKAKLVCPSDVAYGDQGRPPVIEPGATLVFEVELLDIAKQK